MESLHNTTSLRNLNFCGHSARLLRKLNHVLQRNMSITINVLPLHFAPSQASSSQNSNIESYFQYYQVDFLKMEA